MINKDYFFRFFRLHKHVFKKWIIQKSKKCIFHIEVLNISGLSKFSSEILMKAMFSMKCIVVNKIKYGFFITFLCTYSVYCAVFNISILKETMYTIKNSIQNHKF